MSKSGLFKMGNETSRIIHFMDCFIYFLDESNGEVCDMITLSETVPSSWDSMQTVTGCVMRTIPVQNILSMIQGG